MAWPQALCPLARCLSTALAVTSQGLRLLIPGPTCHQKPVCKPPTSEHLPSPGHSGQSPRQLPPNSLDLRRNVTCPPLPWAPSPSLSSSSALILHQAVAANRCARLSLLQSPSPREPRPCLRPGLANASGQPLQCTPSFLPWLCAAQSHFGPHTLFPPPRVPSPLGYSPSPIRAQLKGHLQEALLRHLCHPTPFFVSLTAITTPHSYSACW